MSSAVDETSAVAPLSHLNDADTPLVDTVKDPEVKPDLPTHDNSQVEMSSNDENSVHVSSDKGDCEETTVESESRSLIAPEPPKNATESLVGPETEVNNSERNIDKSTVDSEDVEQSLDEQNTDAVALRASTAKNLLDQQVVEDMTLEAAAESKDGEENENECTGIVDAGPLSSTAANKADSDMDVSHNNEVDVAVCNVSETHCTTSEKSDYGGAKESTNTDEMKVTLNILQDFTGDVSVSNEENNGPKCKEAEVSESVIVESSTSGSAHEVERLSEKSTLENDEKSQSENSITDSVEKKCENEPKETSIDIAKESTTRNVFDAFPITLQSQEQNGEQNTANDVGDVACEKSQKIESNEKEGSIDERKSTNNVESSETKTSRKKQISVNTSESQVEKSTKNNKEKSNTNEESKVTSKANTKTKKEQKSLSQPPQEKDIQESDIIKKAKEKYNLKELRISLHTDEVSIHTDEIKDSVETSASVAQNEKVAFVKAPKPKETTNDGNSGEASNDISEELPSIETTSKASDSNKEDLPNSSQGNKNIDLSVDNDSLKPLKKRGRRGYDEASDKGNVANKTEMMESESNNLSVHCSDEGLLLDSSVDKAETDDHNTHEMNKQTQKNEPSLKRKGRKEKKKSKRLIKGSTKQIAPPLTLENETKEAEIRGKDKDNVQEEPVHDISETENVSNEPVGSEEPSDIPSTTQLKKYPGRSCKLRHHLPQLPIKPKKPKPPKTKVVESETLPKTGESPTKIKKKRKRKVKPWSWGNEKKKYKPKLKVPVSDVEIPLENNVSMADIDSEMPKPTPSDSSESFNAKDNVIDTTTQMCEPEISSGSNSKELSDAIVVPETEKNESIDKFDNHDLNISDKVEKKERRSKKKGKKGRKKKSGEDLKSLVCTFDENVSEGPQTHTGEPVSNLTSSEQSVTNETKDSDCNIDDHETFDSKSSNNIPVSEEIMSDISKAGTSAEPEVLDQAKNVEVNEQCSETIIKPPSAASKRKRSRSRKGEGKGRPKKKKTDTCATSSGTGAQEESVVDESSELDNNAKIQAHGEMLTAANVHVVEQVENELPVDNYPHVSPDSGIQSLAGSPAGNESPNSVIINVDNSNNAASTSGNDIKQGNESLSKDKESSKPLGLCSSSSNSVSDTKIESEIKIGEAVNDIDVEDKVPDSDGKKSVKESKSRKDSGGDTSPSKKKNRAKFLHLHKRSTLLQKGRLPTEEEKEKRLDDKFDYPEKVVDKLTASPPIDLYSQHMNSFQVTLGEGVGNTTCLVDKEIASDFSNSVPSKSESVSKKVGKKSHSKHKGKRKGASSNSKSAIFDKMTDLQGQVETLLGASFTASVVVSSSSSVISDYSPVYHSSSALTPVTSTLTSVAVTDTVSTSCSVTKPISSVVETVSTASELNVSDMESAKSNMDVTTNLEESGEALSMPVLQKHVENNDIETIPSSDLAEIEGIDTNLSQSYPVLTKKKRGRPPSKKKKVIALKNKIHLKAKKTMLKPLKSSCDTLSLNVVVEKRHRGRPKGSKNKSTLLKEKKRNELLTLSLPPQLDRIETLGDVNQNNDKSVTVISPGKDRAKKAHLSPVRDNNTSALHDDHVKGNSSGSPGSHQNKDKSDSELSSVCSSVKAGLSTSPDQRGKGHNASVTSDNKVKGAASSNSQDKVKHKKTEDLNSAKSQEGNESDKNPSFSNTMMAWRESSVLSHDKEEKKKRGPGRPRKYPIGSKRPTGKKRFAKIVEPKTVSPMELETPDSTKSKAMIDEVGKTNECVSDSISPVDDVQLPPVFKEDELSLLDESVKQLPKIRKSKLHPMLKKGKRGRKKGQKPKKVSEQSVEVIEEEGAETEDIVNLTDLQPARSVSSHDSDTSGAGSSFGSKSFQVQMWMEMSKHKRKKNKQKLRYFRSKHKNIIDPVLIAKVDCLIDDLSLLSISPPSETFLKVRPWEVPLPSIFKIVRINIKKKKKDRLFVFEKAKPLKPKNELESGPKDKIKLGRKIGDHLMDLSDVTDQQHCNLPPKKRHKLFSALGPEETFTSPEVVPKPEKRKAGRPRKVRPPSPEQSTSFSFGEVHKTKPGFEMGQDTSETLASFASVAAQSCQSPNSSFSPDKDPPSFSQVSPRHRDSQRAEKSHPTKQTNKSDSAPAVTSSKKVPSSAKPNEVSESGHLAENSSCGKCAKLQATEGESENSETVRASAKLVNSKHLNRKVKKLKRKYRKSKFTKVKRKVSRPIETIRLEDSVDLDSSVRSVCSESEPLPSFHLDKQNLDSDSEDEIVQKRPKILKRRASDNSHESDSTASRKQNGPSSQKKKYQKAGLYSDSYKDDERSDPKDVTDTYFTFDLPLHFGQHQLKNMINDFQLPFDVWWLHFNDMLPKKGDGNQYRRIRNNIYVDTRPACKYEAHPCTCKKPLNPAEKGCGEDCINRLVYTECSAGMCPCYDQCNNQSIQKHQFASGLNKFVTKDRGFGVRSAKPIRQGQLIVEYCGEVVSEQEFRRRMTEEYSQDRNHYCLNLDSGTVIDGYRKGNVARFVNHSCEPNCEMQKWNVEGVYRMCLFALQDIEPGEELVYDYNFQSFNHDAQQLCKCGSKACRGIIGGKKQWFNGQGKPDKPATKKSKLSKDKRKSKQKLDKLKEKSKSILPGYQQGMPGGVSTPMSSYFSYPVKPLGKKERVYARKHSIFLVRNFDRIRGLRHRLDQDSFKVTKENEDYIKGTHFTKRDVFFAQLTALKTSRSMKTRRLTVAEEDTELGKMARIAGVCKEIYSAISTAKDNEGNFLATDLYHLPSKKKHPRYYQVIDEPIDLTMMENKILSGVYQSVEAYEKDMNKLFQNVEIYCGKKSEMGDKIRALRTVFANSKRKGMSQIMEIMGPEVQSSDSQVGTPLSDVDMQVATPTTSISSESDISEISDNKGEWLQGEEEEEEIIRCICGIYKDEGLMIQCDKCYIWQHTDCMQVKGDIGNYLCDQCDPRPVNREVELVPGNDDVSEVSEDGNRYFMTLMRDDMQIRLGGCVYVMKENQSRRYSYKKSGGLDKDRMDIFRIERLWKTRKGEKFAFGHMYVRPHETFHEPNRKFFPNEVFRTPLYEMFQLDTITGYCCVMDLLTYCKGKPKGYKEEDLYICEHRMDKTLHLFYKISPKQRCPINTRSYCFDMYEKRRNPKRTYSPHEVPESYKRNWREKSTGSSDDNPPEKKHVIDEEEDIPLVKVKIERRKEKRERVNKLVDALSKGKLSPSKKRSDLTYLLTN